MACFSQDSNAYETQQWSQHSLWMTWNRPQFGLHGSSLASRDLRNVKLFHDVELNVVGSHIPPNVEGNGDTTMGGKTEEIATKEEDPNKENERHQFQNQKKHHRKIQRMIKSNWEIRKVKRMSLLNG